MDAPTLPPPPRHVAIIMDGNGRWARSRGLPRTAGHKRGADAVRRTVEAARTMGVSYLTLYAFSSENWKRPETEISDLMGLLRLYLRNELRTMLKNGVRLRVIGDRTRLAPDIISLVEETEEMTKDHTAMTLLLALSYGGRQDILQAAQRLVRDGVTDVTEAALSERLWTAGCPDPDLLIRTSGEQRISNFLLWQCAYAEFVFQDVLWPDYGSEYLQAAIAEFHRRERRFGTTGE